MNNSKNKPVHLPMVPVNKRAQTAQDEFWQQQGTSGAINAFRQLTNTRHRGRRKQVALPGGKLKPLFKNHTAPPRSDGGSPGTFCSRPAKLPGIKTPPLDVNSALYQVICGGFNDLPVPQPSTVRVYLASNYDDMRTERQYLMREAVPEIQEFCSKFGLQFQLVDLSWGTDVDPHDVSGTTDKLRLQEILECQNLSLGPHFVVLLGDKYGNPKLPGQFTTEEYEVINSLLKNEEHQALINKAYLKDENTATAFFIFQRADLSKEEQVELCNIIGEAVSTAVQQGKMPIQTAKLLYLSALEEDVMHGIFDTKDPRSHCLCFRREWQNIESHTNKPETAIYVDTVTSEAGEQKLDTKLRERHRKMTEQVSQHLGVGAFKPYYLKWPEDGGDPQQTAEFKAYIENMCQDFVTDIKHLIVQGVERKKKSQGPASRVFLESLHHAYICKQKVEHFKGQIEVLFRIEKFLKDPRQNNRPLVVHGMAGCGKTSVMAAVATRLRHWFSPDAVVIVRFLATSAESANIYQTVVSITTQICLVYGLRVPLAKHDMNTLHKALAAFRRSIEVVSQEYASTRPLFILLDGISQLQPLEESMRALWAIRDFPSNVHLILSTTTKDSPTDLLQALVTFVTEESACVEVGALSSGEAGDVLDQTLFKVERTLTENQRSSIITAYENNPSPLYMQHLINIAKNWASFDTDLYIPDSTSTVLTQTIKQLEGQYGKQLTTYVLAYIAISGIGMQERELLDLLTCNSEVGSELAKHKLSMGDISYVPPLLWSRMKQELRPFLTHQLDSGKAVLGLSQTAYFMITSDMYGTIYPGIQEDKITTDGTAFTLSLYEDISKRYMNQPLPITGKGERHSEEETELILVSPQPTNKHNVLKLNRLPLIFYILLPVQGLTNIKESIFFNYDWLLTKLKATSTQAIYKDLLPVISMTKHFTQDGILDENSSVLELEMLFEFLQLAQASLAKDSNYLGNEIIGRLSGLDTLPDISSLVKSVHLYLNNSKEKALVPLYPCLHPPGSFLRHTLDGASHLVGLIQNDTMLVTFHQHLGVVIWLIETGEMRQLFPINVEQPLSGVVPMQSGEFIVIGHYSHLNHVMELSVWSTNTGVCIVKSTFPQRFETFALDPEDKIVMVSSIMQIESPPNETQRCLMGVDIKTRDIIYTMPVNDVHKEGIHQIHFVKGMRKGLSGLVTVGSKLSKDIAYWDLETEELEYKINLSCFVNHVRIHAEQKIMVCVSSDAGRLVVVDLAKGEVKKAVEKITFQSMADIYVSNAGEHAVLATVHEGICVYSLTSGEMIKVLNPGTNTRGQHLVPSKVTMDEVEYSIIVGYQTGDIQIYAAASGQLLHTFEEHSSRINSLIYETSGKLITSSEDGTGKVINLMPVVAKFGTHFATDVESWDGIKQFTQPITEGNTIKSLKLELMEGVGKVHPSDNLNISKMVVTSDGKTVVAGSRTNPITAWHTETGKLSQVITENCDQGVSSVYLACREKLVVGHANIPNITNTKAIQVWNLESGEMVKSSEEPMPVYCSLAIPDSDRIFTVSPSNKNRHAGIILGVYDLFEMRYLATLHCNIYGHMDWTNLKLLGASKVTQSTSQDQQETPPAKTYILLDYYPDVDTSFFFTFVLVEKDGVQISIEHHDPIPIDTYAPECTAILGPGQAVSGTVEGSLVMWNLAENTISGNLFDPTLTRLMMDGRISNLTATGRPAHNGKVTCLSVSQDHRVMVTGGADAKVKVWTIPDHGLLQVLTAHSAQVEAVCLSSDSMLVVSGSADKTIHVWNRLLAEKLASFYTHDSIVSLVLTPDNARVILQAGQRKSKIMILKTCNL